MNMNINIITEELFELIVERSSRKFKIIIDQHFYDDIQISPILKSCREMLKAVLETHINDKEFFVFEKGAHELLVSFFINLGCGVEDKIVLKLKEINEGFKANMRKHINTLEYKMNFEERVKRIEENSDEGKEKLYMLDQIKYSDEDDYFVTKFNWTLACQEERERFVELSKKYFIMGFAPHEDTAMFKPISIAHVEPLCVEVSNKRAHVWGWFDVTKWKNGIEIPKEANIRSIAPRILQHLEVSYGPMFFEGALMLQENKLSIVGPILTKLRPGLNNFHKPLCCANGLSSAGHRVIPRQNKYVVIDTWFMY